MIEIAWVTTMAATVRHWRVAGSNYTLIYVAISLPVLAALCFITGPFQVPDEPAHFFRAIQLSHGYAQPMLGPDGDSAGGLIENSAVNLVDKLGNDSINLNPSHRFVLSDIVSEWNAERAGDALTFTAFSNTVIYFPIAHMLPGISIAIARQIGAPPLAWLYIGRLTNALTAVAISTIAIAIFEETGLFALVFCSLPMVLFEEASLSADALVIPFSVLLSALVARIARNTSLEWDFFIGLFISLLYVSVAKIAYIPLVLLPSTVAIIQKRRFQEILPLFLISAFAVTSWAFWSLLVQNKVFAGGAHSDILDVHLQLQSVLRYPLIFPGAMLRTIFNIHQSLGLIAQAMGAKLGWLNVAMPKYIVALSLTTFTAALIFRESKIPLLDMSRLLILFLLLCSSVMVYFLFYLQYTPVGQTTVDGVQGRYLIPLLAFLPLAIPGWSARRCQAYRLRQLIVLTSEIAAIATVVIVWMAYWVSYG